MSRESIVGTRRRTQSIRERREHRRRRIDQFRRRAAFEQSRQPAIADQPPEVRKPVEVTLQRQPVVQHVGQGAVPEAFEVWAKWLQGGDIAVALLNRSKQAKDMRTARLPHLAAEPSVFRILSSEF